MKTSPSHRPDIPSTRRRRGDVADITKAALDEHELAARWGLSVKTLRRWRQQQLGPIFCKLGSRVVYLITDIEAFERRSARYSTFAKVYA
jgi:hypothetical protein